MINIRDLYDLEYTLAGEYLERFDYPWDVISNLGDIILNLGQELNSDYREISSGIWIHRDAAVANTAVLTSPCILGPGTEVRHCAYLRGSVLAGGGCVIGNSTEVKNALLFDRVQLPHFNYVGDSILGYGAHLGAGAIISNLKADKGPVSIKLPDGEFSTGLRKLGALVGDFAEIGCNCVLNPGTVVGKFSSVYPVCCIRGFIPPRHIVKNNGCMVLRED